ncbi:MAG: DUF1489 family protein [Rhodospirillales bacterium]
MTLHLIKLAVGAKTLDDVRTWQAARAKQSPPLRHRTRNFPKRATEILDGGSIYWVIAGVISSVNASLTFAKRNRPTARAAPIWCCTPTWCRCAGG